MDAGPAGGEGRRRKKKRQRRKRPKRSRMPQQQDRMPPETHTLDDRSVLGGRVPRSQEKKAPPEEGPPDAFALFCAYHLGITSSDGYHKPHPDDVARRFGITPKELRELLKSFELDEEAIRQTDFDLSGAQLDIRVAPAGISRVEIARDLFQDYMEAKETANS